MGAFKKITSVFLFFVMTLSGTAVEARDSVTLGEATALAHAFGSGGNVVRLHVDNGIALESSPFGEFLNAFFSFASSEPLCTLDYLVLRTAISFFNTDVKMADKIKQLREDSIAYEIDGEPVDSTRGPIRTSLALLDSKVIGLAFTQFRIFEPGELSVGEHELLTTFVISGQVFELPNTIVIDGPNDPACQDVNGNALASQQKGKGNNK